MKAKKLKEIIDKLSATEKNESGEFVLSEAVYADAAKALNEYYSSLVKGEEDARMSAGNTRWSAEEDEKLKAEWQSGMKLQKICERHKRSASGIVTRLSYLGVLEEDDLNGKTRWTEEEEAQLISEFNRGYSVEVMARRHGRSLGGIIGRLLKLGLCDEKRFI
mgnify:FL=1